MSQSLFTFGTVSESPAWRAIARRCMSKASEGIFVGEGEDGNDLLELCAEYMPDAILFGPMNFETWQDQILLAHNEFPSVVFFSTESDPFRPHSLSNIEIIEVASFGSEPLRKMAEAFALIGDK